MKKIRRCKACDRPLKNIGAPNKSGYCTNCSVRIKNKIYYKNNRKKWKKQNQK